MAITLKQPFYEDMIRFVNEVAEYYSKIASREGITTVSGAIHDMAALRESCKTWQKQFAVSQYDHEIRQANVKTLALFKTKAKTIEKLFTGIENGLHTKQISTKTELRGQLKEHFKPIVTDVVNHAKKFGVDSTEHDVHSLQLIQKQAHKTVAHIIDAAIKAGVVETKGEEDKQKDKALRGALQAYRSKASELPKTLNGALFSIATLPIVPDIDFSLLSPKVLKSSGLKYSAIDDNAFFVFEDQVLLAFDYAAASTEEDGKRKAASTATFKTNRVPVLGRDKKPIIDEDGKIVTKPVQVANTNSLKARRLSARHTELQENFVLSIIEAINKRSPEKYTLMSSHFEFNPFNGNIMFAWLVPSRSHRVFQNAGNLADARWGFPWGKMSTSTM